MSQTELANDGATITPIDFPLLDGLRVLVVDDDPDTRSLFAFVLQEKGAVVSAEASAEAAMAAMEEIPFDLLISDIGLPNIDGYRLLRQVRALPVAPNAQIPAMAITGFADEQTQLQILAAGFQRMLVKPTDIDQFVAIVAELVGRSQQIV
ncbi:response regulator [Leptolyngbya sp. FACHB-321]|uniref:response regulator n=1 Tax=Leptolyngbya sp. FACHB-321 TaxID=2692807 RepID=UPI001684FB3B|nr:response regulator [Leptolyngbya sp. FACHB-321]MBD2034627.1 response regulator [Leptolyngbya sp. FACHB-321]